MVQPSTVAVFASGKGPDKSEDAFQIQQEEGKDGSRLNDDGVHLPIRVVEWDVHQGFANAKVGRGTDRQELGQALHYSQQNRLNVDVQRASGAQPRVMFVPPSTAPCLRPVDAVDRYALVQFVDEHSCPPRVIRLGKLVLQIGRKIARMTVRLV